MGEAASGILFLDLTWTRNVLGPVQVERTAKPLVGLPSGLGGSRE